MNASTLGDMTDELLSGPSRLVTGPEQPRLRMRHRYLQRSTVGFSQYPEPVVEETNENTAQNSTLMPINDLQHRNSMDSNIGVPTNIGSIPSNSMYDTRIPSGAAEARGSAGRLTAPGPLA